MRHAGHVVDSVHRDHLLSIDGAKGTQSLYLRQVDETGELVYRIPFTQRAGLMTFNHRKPDGLDYHRNLPIVCLSLDTKWDPHSFYDDHGHAVFPPLISTCSTGRTTPNQVAPKNPDPMSVSEWHHSESYSILQPSGTDIEEYSDAQQGTDLQFYGRAYHVDIPQHWRHHHAGPHTHFLRQHDDNEFLDTLSYPELLGFLPYDPKVDSYVFAVREINAFRLLCEDPSALLDTDHAWIDSPSITIGGDPETTSIPTTSIPSTPETTVIPPTNPIMRNASPPPTRHSLQPILPTQPSDWELNVTANHSATAVANWASTKHQYTDEDLERMRPWLAWLPIENIHKTLANTTQMAKAANYPMIRHLASRFKLLNRFRLREVVSTDTIFSSVKAVGGARCAQVFYGLTSHHMDVYGMESKSQFPEVYKEFIRDQGVPSGLHRDNATEQKSHLITQLNRTYEVKESFAEAGNPNQNPVESRAIKWLERAGERLLNQTGAPDFVWAWAYQYLALVNNWTADRTLRWKCPHTKRFGVTPDISALLRFHFYEPVYYLDVEEPTPLSKEKAGYWLGLAHNVGDALTYHILTDDTQSIVQRSVVRSRSDRNGMNKRVSFNPNLDPEITQHQDNQNMSPERPMILSSVEVPIERTHRRLRKLRKGPKDLGEVPRTNINDGDATRPILCGDGVPALFKE